GDPQNGDHATGDVDLAYVEGRFGKRLILRAGRQLVFGGAARALQLDGVNVRARLVDAGGVDVYGGIPTTPRFAVSQGDAATGGRVFFRPSPIVEAGASFVHVMGEGRIDRQEAGVDAHVAASSTISLSAIGLWSTIEGRLAEASLRATWQP